MKLFPEIKFFGVHPDGFRFKDRIKALRFLLFVVFVGLDDNAG